MCKSCRKKDIDYHLSVYKGMSEENQKFSYGQILEDIRFQKKQEWQVAYYVVVLQAALFSFCQAIPELSWLVIPVFIATWAISFTGYKFLTMYRDSRVENSLIVSCIKHLMSKGICQNETASEDELKDMKKRINDDINN